MANFLVGWQIRCARRVCLQFRVLCQVNSIGLAVWLWLVKAVCTTLLCARSTASQSQVETLRLWSRKSHFRLWPLTFGAVGLALADALPLNFSLDVVGVVASYAACAVASAGAVPKFVFSLGSEAKAERRWTIQRRVLEFGDFRSDVER
jgi:hypothetical protein